MEIRTCPLEAKRVVACIGLLLFIPLINLASFKLIEENTRYTIPFLECGTAKVTLTPIVNETMDLQWMASLSSDRIVCLIYLIVFLMKPDFKMGAFSLWFLYVFYEAFRLVNLWLTYENWKLVMVVMPFILIVIPLWYAVLYVYRSL